MTKHKPYIDDCPTKSCCLWSALTYWAVKLLGHFHTRLMLFCQEQVSTSQRKSKKNLPPHVCRSFLSNIHNLKNQSETQLLRRHQESQPGNHALLKIHLASQCLYAYPTSEKKTNCRKTSCKVPQKHTTATKNCQSMAGSTQPYQKN